MDGEVVAESDPRTFWVHTAVGFGAGLVGGLVSAAVPGASVGVVVLTTTAAGTAVGLLTTLLLLLVLAGNAVIAGPDGIAVRRRGATRLVVAWDEVASASWAEGTWWLPRGWTSSGVVVTRRHRTGERAGPVRVGGIAPSRRRMRAATAAHAEAVLARYAPDRAA